MSTVVKIKTQATIAMIERTTVMIPITYPALARSLCFRVRPSATLSLPLREYGMATTPRIRETIDDSPAVKNSSDTPMSPHVKPATAWLLGGCCGGGPGGGCQWPGGACWGCSGCSGDG